MIRPVKTTVYVKLFYVISKQNKINLPPKSSGNNNFPKKVRLYKIKAQGRKKTLLTTITKTLDIISYSYFSHILLISKIILKCKETFFLF